MYPPEIGGKMPEKRKKGQHLTWENRQEIQLGLKNHLSFAAIADVIGCSPDTISKEIRKHRYFKERTKTAGNYNRVNDCKYKDTCKKRNLCNKKKGYHCRIQCKKCYKCMTLCDAYKPYVCPIEHKAPYVCNACEKSATCRHDKYLYNANCAHHEYLETLKSSREGIDMTKAELIELDELISPLIKKGQPIAHIYENHKEEIPCSMRTVYEYIDKCYLSARNIDMHRTVRYKKRTKHEETPKVSPRKKIGHRHDDFLKYIEDHPGIRIVQMDTVEGVKGGKLLQKFLWPENNLMLAYLIDSKEMSNTVRVIDYIEETIGIEEFKELFPVILTDNGSEFADPEKFEKGINGEKRTRLYYCEARHSEQKGELEKNHEYIRYVLPKKTSFDELTQEKVQLMINHINNTSRPKFNGETPINKALKSFDKNAMEKLGLEIILPDEVHLKPDLLK